VKIVSILVSAVLVLCASAFATPAQDKKPLKVIVFPSGSNWPIFVAQEKGFFANQGVAVNIIPTPDSKTQMVGLIDGQYDIAMTAMDNVVAYTEGQGAAPTTAKPDIFAFMGSDNGFLRLVALPDVHSIDDLKGTKIGVDALSTGYAFVLRQLLELGGLKPGDYEFIQAGGVKQRFDALIKKDIAATLLVSPLEAAARRQGFNLLANASEVLGAYQGVVGAARRDWADVNEEPLIGYLAAYKDALSWLFDPANKQDAIAILLKSVPNMTPSVAEASYGILLDRNSGFFREAAIDKVGVAKVLELRNKYAEPRKELTDSSKYYDERFVNATKK
jgi:ABC-type nitrate/sulfonate/bicarbonate transport system substrate-binding protein